MTYLEIEVSIEHFTTNMATESLDTSMNFYMLIEVSPLCEAKLAILEGTYIWPLVSVNSEVIKKIVPFTEPFIAPFMITF